MPFQARSAREIRDAILADWQSKYAVEGKSLDITPGSDSFNLADALSFELEAIEIAGQQAAHDVLIGRAVGEELDRHAEDDGTARKAPSAARLTVTVAGPPSTTTAVGSATLSSAAGRRYQPIDPATGAPLSLIVTDGAGAATITVEASEAGAAGTAPATTLLSWSTAPVGFAPTGTVASIARVGEDAELDAALRTRLLERRRERPASGNRADWREWCRAVAGVGDAFVHPCAQPPDPTASPARPNITPNRPGCVSAIVVTPAPAASSYVQNADGTLEAGLSPSYSRRPSEALCEAVADYIEGTRDAAGDSVPAALQRQLVTGVLDRANWGVVRPYEVAVDVEVKVKVEPDVWVFASPRTIASGSSTSSLNLDNAFGITLGTRIAVTLPAGHIRGNVWCTVVQTAVGNTVTVSPPLPTNPSPGAAVYYDPGAGLWSALRAQVLAYFDALGPGGAADAGRSARHPDVTWGASDRVSPGQILARVSGVAGVVDAKVEAPAEASTAALGYLPVPGTITFRRLL